MTKLYVYGVVAALALSASAGLYVKGRMDGRAAVLAKAQKELVEQLEERGMTDAEIADMPDADKCELIGGVFVDGICQ